MASRYFIAIGKVQGVMFRQTIMRGAMKRGIKAGATNLPNRCPKPIQIYSLNFRSRSAITTSQV
jgi:hypothetical protein